MVRYTGKNFTPYETHAVSASTTSANQTFTQPAQGESARDLLVQNPTDAVVFVKWGTTAQTATASSFPVMPGAIMIIDTGTTPATNVAVLLSSGTGTIYLSLGVGA